MIIETIVLIWCIGYLACIFSWFFSQEATDLVKEGQVSIYGILIQSLKWPYILYISINATFKDNHP